MILSFKKSSVFKGQGERGQWAVYYTIVPKVLYKVLFFVGLTTLKTLIGWFIKLSVQTFQPIIGDAHQFFGYCLSLYIPG